MKREDFIKTALKPVGQTMYVLGGGWNEEDTGAGKEAVTLGVDEGWKRFYEKCTKDYDFKKVKAPRKSGLDCTGFAGWAIYNAIEQKREGGYVFKSGEMGQRLAALGLGEWKESFGRYKRGDLFCKDGHVWICLDYFSDNSVLILHSSPPGVQVNGAPKESFAHRIADIYMREKHPDWHEKYPKTWRGEDYFKDYGRFRFYWDK